MTRRRDTHTIDLFSEFEPQPVVARFTEDKVRAWTPARRLSRAIAATLDEAAISREKIAEALSEQIGERVSKAMLDAYASPEKPHAISALRLAGLAMVTGDVRALKTGLRVGGVHYLAGWMNVGDRVLVRMDEADMGRVFVFVPDGETYLGDAISQELAGVDRAAFMAAARAEQRRRIAEKIGEAKRVKLKPVEFADSIRRQALREAGTLIEFPKPETPHTTPALAAASTP